MAFTCRRKQIKWARGKRKKWANDGEAEGLSGFYLPPQLTAEGPAEWMR